ncbi:fatty acid desaturase [Mycolicibacterium sp. F2034L]|uniref:fatty acid desaturase family protein n=1 Tax=Mycolicibacterium sp. F2034L TaxID=2926422 RepID=UPI001FF4360F|nr:fatty acid desaturase [Mycolicibacterium sp. F2034L]MCK0176930.1 fatty acid desaturase [Mycolicibacterium sp. F2034L]
MAITDVAQYAHLSETDLQELGAELDEIRRDVEDSRGARDAAYIRRTIAGQRLLEVGSRLVIALGRSKASWGTGVAALAAAKIVENMEIGHNVGHGQWDWMNDPEIHSNTWEWDMAGPSSQWRYSHNYRHHVFTNVLDMDDDLGYGVMRVSRDQPWEPRYLWQPLRNVVMAIGFEWGIARHDMAAAKERAETAPEKAAQSRAAVRKVARQAVKDFVVFPALGLRRWRRVLSANGAANIVRNLWAYVVIFCGHFPDGAEKFAASVIENESKPEWYLRQMLGTANFRAGPLMAFASGNLCFQIEHHLFPDLPSNRYAEIAVRVRALCERFGLPYTTGSLSHQYLQTLRTIHRLALPDREPMRNSVTCPARRDGVSHGSQDGLPTGTVANEASRDVGEVSVRGAGVAA